MSFHHEETIASLKDEVQKLRILLDNEQRDFCDYQATSQEVEEQLTKENDHLKTFVRTAELLQAEKVSLMERHNRERRDLLVSEDRLMKLLEEKTAECLLLKEKVRKLEMDNDHLERAQRAGEQDLNDLNDRLNIALERVVLAESELTEAVEDNEQVYRLREENLYLREELGLGDGLHNQSTILDGCGDASVPKERDSIRVRTELLRLQPAQRVHDRSISDSLMTDEIYNDVHIGEDRSKSSLMRAGGHNDQRPQHHNGRTHEEQQTQNGDCQTSQSQNPNGEIQSQRPQPPNGESQNTPARSRSRTMIKDPVGVIIKMNQIVRDLLLKVNQMESKVRLNSTDSSVKTTD
ncbi:hypothetical protein L596_003958 [Steinernema carpocapsae]|uniref:NUDE domain-containing protein n=1 Tax=Steinernema carpocapsae TaxID=34508 RepID=A0A4U8UXL7_STECR|nr:hypothetical protein L596_003958 [Steinernema carpocapsae]